MPSADSSVVGPLLFDLKSKLAKLEQEMYRKSGPEMKQKLETMLAQLEQDEFEPALDSLATLSEILDPNKDVVFSYQPFLNGKADRIVVLVAKQLRFFMVKHMKTVLQSPTVFISFIGPILLIQ